MEGECWGNAIEEFRQAIGSLREDTRGARPFGMHFRDYFPHREMGICYFELGNSEEAIKQLELSMQQAPSARSKYYLNQTRRLHLLNSGLDAFPPTIHLEFSKEKSLTNQTPFKLKGTVTDDQYVASISINQDSLFIELSDPSIPFTYSIDLKEGLNTIQVTATDLVDRKTEKVIQIYLDQQGPSVMAESVQEESAQAESIRSDHTNGPDHSSGPDYNPRRDHTTRPDHDARPDHNTGTDRVFLSALIYDESGLTSFKLNQKEILNASTDKTFLIKQYIPLTPGLESIPFKAQDKAGNITQGEFSLIPSQKRKMLDLSQRLAFNDRVVFHDGYSGDGGGNGDDGGSSGSVVGDGDHGVHDIFLAHKESSDILFDMKKPHEEKSETYYEEIFLEGKIESRNGIKKVALNDQPLFDMDRILADTKVHQGPHNHIYEIAQKYNVYYLNKGIPVNKEFMELKLQVADHMGRSDERKFIIKKIPRSQVFENEQHMSLAVIPFDLLGEDSYDPELVDYIDKTILNSFKLRERFEVVPLDQLPWSSINRACKSKWTCDKQLIRKIGKSTNADGIICGHIKRWLSGVEIKAEFRDTEEGESRLTCDVFTPDDTPKDLKTVISGLAMKFRDSFPEWEGKVVGKDGYVIYVDMGSNKGIFPGMKYNISKDKKSLLTKASVKGVTDKESEARIVERRNSKKVERGDYVRTR